MKPQGQTVWRWLQQFINYCLQVVDRDLQGSMGIEEIPLHVQYVVLPEWFSSSLHQHRRAYEDYYSLFHVSLIIPRLKFLFV